MNYSPVKIFADKDCSKQIFNEMRTTEWWWDVQVSGYVFNCVDAIGVPYNVIAKRALV